MSKKKIIIGIFIVIIIIIIIVFFIKRSRTVGEKSLNSIETDYVFDSQGNEGAMPIEEGVVDKKELQVIGNVWYDDDYFNIKNIIENYYIQFNNKNEINEGFIPRALWEADENTKKKYIAEQNKDRQNSSQENLYYIYGKEYKKEFNIKEKSNIKIDSKNVDYTNIMIDNMKEVEIPNNIILYIASGKRINIKTKQKQDLSIMIAVDYRKMTYSVYPEDYVTKHNYNKLKIGEKINIKIESIEKNEYNSYEAEEFTDENICKEYLETLRDRIVYETDDIYNFLDKDYIKARFNNSKESYNEYLKNNKELFYNVKLDKYRVNGKDYICIDNYNNQYKFRRKNGLLDYTIFLDNYSIVDNYKEQNNNNKAAYQLTKFIRQINTRDYENIYNHLNNEYKDTNFKTIEEMKRYINTNFYKINDVEITNNQEQPEYNVMQCKLTNMENKKQNKKLYVIVKLGQDMNYTISFSFD